MSRSTNDFDFSFQTSAGTTWHMRDNEDDTHTLAMEQDCTDIMDYAAALRGENDGWPEDKSFCRISTVPFVVLEDWKNMGVDWNDPDGAKWVMSKLMSNEYYKLRTGNIKV